MNYTIDLFKANCYSDSPAFFMIKDSLANDEAHESMINFNTEAIRDQLFAVLVEQNNIETIKIRCNHNPLLGKQWIAVITSYSIASQVIALLMPIVLQHDLNLFDRQNRNATWRASEILNTNTVELNKRVPEIENNLKKSQKGYLSIKEIESSYSHGYNIRQKNFVLILKKDMCKPLEARTEDIYNCLKENLTTDESLSCKNRCFTVSSPKYKICYCVEAYGKSCDKICFVENGKPQAEIMHRMGVSKAIKSFDYMSDLEKEDTLSRLIFNEMNDAFPNPADRFVKSVNITKTLSKEKFGIRYSSLGYYGSEFIFHLTCEASSPMNDHLKGVSCLKIEEASVSFILPIISDVYPLIYDRYYLKDNPLPFEMWFKIIERMRYISNLIVNDTFNPELQRYIEDFDIYVLSSEEYFKLRDSDDDRIIILDKKTQFLYDHRHEVARFYHMFITWLEMQIEYESSFDLINVEGP